MFSDANHVYIKRMDLFRGQEFRKTLSLKI